MPLRKSRRTRSATRVGAAVVLEAVEVEAELAGPAPRGADRRRGRGRRAANPRTPRRPVPTGAPRPPPPRAGPASAALAGDREVPDAEPQRQPGDLGPDAGAARAGEVEVDDDGRARSRGRDRSGPDRRDGGAPERGDAGHRRSGGARRARRRSGSRPGSRAASGRRGTRAPCRRSRSGPASGWRAPYSKVGAVGARRPRPSDGSRRAAAIVSPSFSRKAAWQEEESTLTPTSAASRFAISPRISW